MPDNTTSNSPPETENTLHNLREKLDNEVKELEKDLGGDKFADVTGVKAGTQEDSDKRELAGIVSEIHSTGKSIKTYTYMKWAGNIGLVLGFIVTISGMVYDLNYHIPKLYEKIGFIPFSAITVLFALLVLLMTHAPIDGLLNKKWDGKQKIFFIFLLVAGLSAKAYLDWRAISNWSKAMAEDSQAKRLKSNITVSGVQNSALNIKMQQVKAAIESKAEIEKDINQQLKDIANSKAQINADITSYKDKKSQRISKKEMKKINSLIYTSRKQRKALIEDETNLLARLASIAQEKKNLINELSEIAKEKKNVILEDNKESITDKNNRITFFIVLVFAIEFATFLKPIGGLLVSSNMLKYKGLEELLDEMREGNNVLGLAKHYIQLENRDREKEFRKEMDMNRVQKGVSTNSRLLGMYQDIQETKQNVKLLNEFSKVVGEVNRQAINSIGKDFENGLLNAENKKLKKFIEEKIGE